MADTQRGYHRAHITSAIAKNFKNPDGTLIPGISVQRNGKGIVHLTPADARTLAVRLLGLADDIEDGFAFKDTP